MRSVLVSEFHEELEGLEGKRARFPLEARYGKKGRWIEGTCSLAGYCPVLKDNNPKGLCWILTPTRLLALELLE